MEQRCNNVDYCTTDYRLQFMVGKNSSFGFFGSAFLRVGKKTNVLLWVGFSFQYFLVANLSFLVSVLLVPNGWYMKSRRFRSTKLSIYKKVQTGYKP